jgi:hypothetical protein
VTDDGVEYDADPPADSGPAGTVRDLPPVTAELAGIEYTFRCPKLAAWAEMAAPALKYTQAARDVATTGAMVLFVHAALGPEDSEAVHLRKYDTADDLDLPDLIRCFAHLVDVWRDEVARLARAAGMRLELGDVRRRPGEVTAGKAPAAVAAKRPAEVVAKRGTPARRRTR